MSPRRVSAVARRVMRQILRDRRTVALLVVAPMIVLTLGAVLFRSEQPAIPLGVVNEDNGVTTPTGDKIAIGERIARELSTHEVFELHNLHRDEIDARLSDGSIDGAIVFPPDFSAGFSSGGQAVLNLRLEGSNPTRSALVVSRATQAAMIALAELSSSAFGTPGILAPPSAEPKLPVVVEATYLYAGPDFDTMDFVAPVYIAFLVLFFVFLLTCVSFLRERSQGTMERLLATPVSRAEIVLGYMAGLGLFALLQSTVILGFTIWALKIHYLGSLLIVFLIVALLAVVGVSLGILASAFARTEFQVVQFIPLVIIPQALLSGTFWAVDEMPRYLQPFGYAMPLTYANFALRDVMLKGLGLAEIWPNLVVLVGVSALLMALGARSTRREVA